MSRTTRRIGYTFLCVVPYVAGVLAAVRPLRSPGVHQTIGVVHFAAVCLAAWILVGGVIRSGAEEKRRLAVAGGLLLTPFALIALLWVGLATPWDATPIENRMRYFVLLVGSIAVTGGFVLLKESLAEAGERLYSTLGFVAAVLGGAAYLIWNSYQLGAHVVEVNDGKVSPTIVSISNVFDVLLFAAAVLAYLATAAFAASLGRIHWLRRRPAVAYVVANFVALLLIAMRGLSFPDPTAATPWYLRPGFVAGIPAVPWIMPFMLGVVLLRRAGDEPRG